jgi:hypothetical protein
MADELNELQALTSAAKSFSQDGAATAPRPAPELPAEPEAPDLGELEREEEADANGMAGVAEPAAPEMPVQLFAAPKEQTKQKRTPIEEPFRMSLLGGQQTGKTYLFFAMVYRAWLGSAKSGALSGFLSDVPSCLRRSESASQTPVDVNIDTVVSDYQNWKTIGTTTTITHYQLSAFCQTGWLGCAADELTVNYVDTRGEAVERGAVEHLSPSLDADVLVFCVPSWAAFPRRGLDGKFQEWVPKYRRGITDTLGALEARLPPSRRRKRRRVILALTMADDTRCELDELREQWIDPFTATREAFRTANEVLKMQGGLNQYLGAARKVSEYLRRCFRDHDDTSVAAIPGVLKRIGRSEPWLIPISAASGANIADLAGVEGEARAKRQAEIAQQYGSPRPAHVELPLLIALCEDKQALM